MRDLAQKACWPLGILAVYAALYDLYVRVLFSIDCEFGSLCGLVKGLFSLVGLVVFGPWMALRWVVETWLGIYALSFSTLTLPIIIVFLVCFLIAFPDYIMDKLSNAASYTVTDKEPKPNPAKQRRENKRTARETQRKSAQAEMDEAVREMEEAKAKLEALKKKSQS